MKLREAHGGDGTVCDVSSLDLFSDSLHCLQNPDVPEEQFMTANSTRDDVGDCRRNSGAESVRQDGLASKVSHEHVSTSSKNLVESRQNNKMTSSSHLSVPSVSSLQKLKQFSFTGSACDTRTAHVDLESETVLRCSSRKTPDIDDGRVNPSSSAKVDNTEKSLLTAAGSRPNGKSDSPAIVECDLIKKLKHFISSGPCNRPAEKLKPEVRKEDRTCEGLPKKRKERTAGSPNTTRKRANL